MSKKYARVGLPRQPPAEAQPWTFTKQKRAHCGGPKLGSPCRAHAAPLGRGYAMFCAERISPLLPPRVMPVDPVPVTVVPTPVSRKPHVVHWTHVITRAVGIIRSIANLYENPDSTRARRKNAARTE